MGLKWVELGRLRCWGGRHLQSMWGFVGRTWQSWSLCCRLLRWQLKWVSGRRDRVGGEGGRPGEDGKGDVLVKENPLEREQGRKGGRRRWRKGSRWGLQIPTVGFWQCLESGGTCVCHLIRIIFVLGFWKTF